MKVKYVLSNPKNMVWRDDSEFVSWDEFYVAADIKDKTVTSNDGRLSESHTANYLHLTDLFINNKFVERNAGDGECSNPALITRDGTSETAPEKNICEYIEIGNAGVAAAHDVNFVATIPSGLSRVETSNIQCQVLANGSRGNTECGESFYYDDQKRIVTGKIKQIRNGGKVVLIVPGKAVDYSSSWKSIARLPKTEGWVERIQPTNTSEQNFGIKGNDAAITKVASIHTATVGDEFTYTITARNPESGEYIKNVSITDKLPESFYYLGTRDIIFNGGANFGEKNTEASIIENINGAETKVDENLAAEKRPIKNRDGKLEWGKFTLPIGSSVSITFAVKVKNAYTCSETVHNSATMHYSLQNDIAHTREYRGDLVGLDTDDVDLTGCTEILANTDFVTMRQEVRDGKAVLVPNEQNVLENDRIFTPRSTEIRPENVNISVTDIRNLDKRLLYIGSTAGISSRGSEKMSNGFKLGNRLEGIGGITPTNVNAGISVFDYRPLPDFSVNDTGFATWKS